MTIPPALTFLNRFSIPLLVSALYLQNQGGVNHVDINEQARLFEKSMRLSDKVLSEARGELNQKTGDVYDYIIVGGGSAGSVLANLLTASGEHSVFLLEAGGDPNPVLEIPFAHSVFWSTRVMDWNYTIVKQTRSCLYYYNGYCDWPRGKALGGTSNINAVLYNRCKPKDYELWANFTGDPFWSWASVKEKFIEIEDYHGQYENEPGSEVNHGKGGNVYVGTLDYLPGIQVLKDALHEKGVPIGDLNGGDAKNRFSTVDYNVKQGMRWGTYRSHLEPALQRTNLKISRYSTATKILFEGNCAVGVEYERHGVVGLKVFAKNEVIVSGGTIESPKLLLLSGIGPKEELEALKIPVVVDLPAVGKYMQDHPAFDVVGEGGKGLVLNVSLGTLLNNPRHVLEFLENRTGPYNAFSSSPRLMKGYLNSRINTDMDWPEIYAYVYTTYINDRSEEIVFSLDLLRTTTNGTVKLASANYKDKPLIDPNYYQDPTDIERFIDGIEAMLDIFMNSKAYQRLGIKMFPPFQFCAKDYQFLSRSYWKCFIEQTTGPHFHPTSTCRMGPNPAIAVVDSKLRVFNTSGLRVVDASVMPFVPSGNTNMPTILIASKAADLILHETKTEEHDNLRGYVSKNCPLSTQSS